MGEMVAMIGELSQMRNLKIAIGKVWTLSQISPILIN